MLGSDSKQKRSKLHLTTQRKRWCTTAVFPTEPHHKRPNCASEKKRAASSNEYDSERGRCQPMRSRPAQEMVAEFQCHQIPARQSRYWQSCSLAAGALAYFRDMRTMDRCCSPAIPSRCHVNETSARSRPQALDQRVHAGVLLFLSHPLGVRTKETSSNTPRDRLPS